MRQSRRSWWLVVPLLIAGTVVVRGGGCTSSSKQPDERLAAHFSEICRIAGRNIETPEPGVRKLMRYLGDHSPDMLHDWGEMLVLIERIDDDDAHDKRAERAASRLHFVFMRCAEPMNDFFEAVEEDPEATRVLDHGLERLSRTLDIIGGNTAADLRRWPAVLRRRVDAVLVPR